MSTGNVNPAEVAKFERLASRWWDSEGESRPLHDLNPVRLGYIAERAVLKGARVVDVGCGGGLLSEAMASAGADVVGIDLAPAVLEVARLHLLESGLKVDYRETGAEALAQTMGGEFDVVTCLEMLEHVPDPASVIRACADLLRPGGRLFVSTLNRTPRSFATAIVGAEYVMRLLPRGTHHYARFIKPSELGADLRAAGLVLEDLRGIGYNPLTRKAWLSDSVAVNYLACAVKPA
ncbi:MAG: bifunctional 2-polyprenyl-6-hydroxyphenol methylase/3-demethylubiquinol 3-O-methyltransferase UbiG [Dokdonella sp.]|nr:bifunctional 2-polyprenyl-6-hydroxyphenol methylase/3-demethylubiquinol 3-O-methyltransferase UbiG [Dokdonella sp.]MCB1575308.1 bifunctional 2-polyprenyl-6-hydroxyphenol methylase/3-demethylubiquinol 3-O-methyltransferase UbiG [Xanthomonadales bacterium]MCB1578309.1 bifunctional 2-polyprenyl-6-hydroxyphenol methylase/3-demethylubiquinol 3-O-methyltransferase UbiG [Xanthomonadales bacterium]